MTVDQEYAEFTKDVTKYLFAINALSRQDLNLVIAESQAATLVNGDFDFYEDCLKILNRYRRPLAKWTRKVRRQIPGTTSTRRRLPTRDMHDRALNQTI